jgi:hypothetical protein
VTCGAGGVGGADQEGNGGGGGKEFWDYGHGRGFPFGGDGHGGMNAASNKVESVLRFLVAH